TADGRGAQVRFAGRNGKFRVPDGARFEGNPGRRREQVETDLGLVRLRRADRGVMHVDVELHTLLQQLARAFRKVTRDITGIPACDTDLVGHGLARINRAHGDVVHDLPIAGL